MASTLAAVTAGRRQCLMTPWVVALPPREVCGQLELFPLSSLLQGWVRFELTECSLASLNFLPIRFGAWGWG